MRENELWVNTATATKLAVRNGSYVRLKNQDGVVSNPIRVKATQRIRPDTVYMVYGFGQRNTMARFGSGRGASAAQLNTRYATDPLMGGTSLHANFVTLVKEA
jgi:thiosulfate reductase/polysulfide reductase chain A